MQFNSTKSRFSEMIEYWGERGMREWADFLFDTDSSTAKGCMELYISCRLKGKK